MAITFRHDAAAVTPPSNSATRKYGQQLVLQQQQQKYQGLQAGYDRLFQLGRDAQQNAFQVGRELRQQNFIQNRDDAQNRFQMDRDKVLFEQQQKQQEAARQQAFMEEARKQSGRFIMDSIEKGEYDDVTARELRQNLIEEAEALGNPALDATQRAEALNKLRARRAVLSANRMPKTPPPTAQEQFDNSIVTDSATGTRYRQNAKGDYEPIQEAPKRPTSAAEAFQADPKVRDKYMEQAIAIETKGGDEPLTVESRRKASALAQQLYEEDNNLGTPTDAPQLPGAAPATPGQSKSILEGPTAQMPDRGQPPAPVQPLTAQTPDPGQPPAPSPASQYGAQMTGQGYQLVNPGDGTKPYYMKDTAPLTASLPDAGQPPAPAQANKYAARPAPGQPPAPAPIPIPEGQQQVKVGGKSLVVSPGSLTPQETAARAEIMKLPREQRIEALIPYDQELKGKTLQQILDDPQTKAGYDELTRQGLTTGNYREDMLAHMDEMLQHNVLKGAGTTPQDAYVGMKADDITDPKVKAEVAKLPRPKSADERASIRSGQLYVDPDGIIRTRA